MTKIDLYLICVKTSVRQILARRKKQMFCLAFTFDP